MLILHKSVSNISISSSIDKLCSISDKNNVNEKGEKRSYIIQKDKEPMEVYILKIIKIIIIIIIFKIYRTII